MNALAGRIRLMVGRAIVNLVNDATKLQSLQVDMLSDETQDDVERFQDYGFTSHPHPGAEAVIVCVGGLRSHSLAIRVDDRSFRLTGLEEGEVAMFDDLGNIVKLGRQSIEITGVTKVKVASPEVVIEAADEATATAPKVIIQASAEVSVAAPKITVEGTSEVAVTAPKVVIDSGEVSLGGEGGKAIARIDDMVDLATGKIISGSDKVKAA